MHPLINYPLTDPSVHVFEDRLYVYGGSDAFLDPELRASENLEYDLHMQNYHVFSSENLVEWVDHGEIFHVRDVPWAKSHLWAPDCAHKNGKYYFYFPATPKVNKWGRTGVAVSDSPSGPFTVLHEPMPGVYGGEPCVFQDGDAYYMYIKPHLPQPEEPELWVARLAGDMISVAEDFRKVEILNQPNEYMFFEGPWVHKYNGKYYLSYPATRNKVFGAEHICYAVSDSPYGPFRYQGVIMKHDPENLCGTNHGSIVEYREAWYLFFHKMDLGRNIPGGGRKMCCQKIHYNPDGTICPLT
ncbi:MAG: family 43 glycosylhydrolase [Verrucomicrobia bacterium]|nr:family 43 glycosylhydrolase [Verrucomicrobiota bacterium]MCH8527551.1 family 43 glycosylhydrolase [Kiritimatiellia bacterium]